MSWIFSLCSELPCKQTNCMPEDNLHQPHDKLFHIGFRDPVNAAALLRTQLPAEIAEQIDWSALKLEDGNFVDAEFRKSHTDLLFSTTFAGRECRIYLLFEHQSTEDPYMALRLLIYETKIWIAFARENPGKPLPIILPVVLAQNAKSWKVQPQFSSLLDLPAGLADVVAPLIPDFRFALMQLAEQDFAELPGTPAGVLYLRVMKAERMADLLNDWVWDDALISQIPWALLEPLLRYILGADVDRAAFENKLQTIRDVNTRQNAMSLAQIYRHEGRQEGVTTLVVRQLRRKFPAVANKVEPLLLGLDEERLTCFGEALMFMQAPEQCLEWFAQSE
jgi:hypothetical protein